MQDPCSGFGSGEKYWVRLGQSLVLGNIANFSVSLAYSLVLVLHRQFMILAGFSQVLNDNYNHGPKRLFDVAERRRIRFGYGLEDVQLVYSRSLLIDQAAPLCST